ncbi:MAG: YceI family protein [Magnetococcales bacterium]|nr:YceI family protein [Magnetococcales bacterium]
MALFGLAAALLMATPEVRAAAFDIDPDHSFVEFRIAHLGYSVLKGRFNVVRGSFDFDEKNPAAAAITMEVETTSIDTNHAKRDKHLRSGDFLDVERYPKATFKSVSFVENGGTGRMSGDLTLHGVTRRVEFPVTLIGSGPDPWGGFRRGYEGHLEIVRADYGIAHNLGPAAERMTLDLFIEGIRR